jgi:CRP-like cAMP-binding protein
VHVFTKRNFMMDRFQVPPSMDSIDPESGSELAAQQLTAPKALSQLSIEEARMVVRYMEPAHFAEDVCFIREGDAADTGFMALVIHGEVIVENITVSRTAPVTIAVLGPGSLVGEIGLLDSGPRSASCTAGAELFCAILTRDALKRLIEENPTVGAKFLLAVAARIAERLRNTARKLRMYANLATAMQQELDRGVK